MRGEVHLQEEHCSANPSTPDDADSDDVEGGGGGGGDIDDQNEQKVPYSQLLLWMFTSIFSSVTTLPPSHSNLYNSFISSLFFSKRSKSASATHSFEFWREKFKMLSFITV
jgi:hypothetical protein